MKAKPFPGVVSLETCSKCNARCVMCIPRKLIRRSNFMSVELFKQIVDQLPRCGVVYVVLAHFGEPLLDPRIIERVAYIHEGLPNTKISIWTNGQRLTLELFRALVGAGLRELSISIDSVHKKTFEVIRRRLRFETVLMNAERCLQEPQDSCSVQIHQTLTPYNIGEDWEEFKTYWNTRGARLVDRNLAESGSGLNPRMTKNIGEPEEPCAHPFNNLTIMSNGKAVFCCKDSIGMAPVGDARTQSIEEIWHSKELKRVRELHNAGRKNEIPLCAACGTRR